MKKIVIAMLLLVSLTSLARDSWKTADLGRYQVKPVSLEKPLKTQYLFEFDIKYNKKSVGFHHHIKLAAGDRILEVQEVTTLSSPDNTNQRALVQIKIPRNFASVNFDGICFINKKTGEIEKIFNI